MILADDILQLAGPVFASENLVTHRHSHCSLAGDKMASVIARTRTFHGLEPPWVSTGDFLIIGHRGAAGLAPENTMKSFRRAFACEVDAVELDVYAVDSRLAVIHDPTVDRTTNGRGPGVWL